MIRTFIIPDKQTITFDIPKEYIGKRIEVIAFAKDEEITKEQPKQKIVSFDALDIDTRDYKFNREEANDR